MATLGAFFDANVLYPAGLRNFLMYLALTGIFRAHWSAEVHEEWMRNLLKNRPDITRDKLKATAHHPNAGEDQTAETDDSTGIDSERFECPHKRLSAGEVHRSLGMGNARKGEHEERRQHYTKCLRKLAAQWVEIVTK